MRNWATYNPSEASTVPAATLDAPDNSTVAESVLLHNKVMAGLSALQRLQEELELTFHAAQETRKEGPVEWDEDNGHTLTTRSAVNEGEEVALSMELQGVMRTSYGKAHSVVLRVPWAFELQPTGTATPSTRSCTPRPETPSVDSGRASPDRRPGPLEGPRWSDGKRRVPGCKMTGDHCHALNVCLQERVPETILLQRVAPPAKGSGPTDSAAKQTQRTKRPGEWLRNVEQESALREDTLVARLEQHIQACQEARTDAEGEDVQFSLQREMPEGCRLEDYLRDIREVVRFMRYGLPTSARLLEGAVKGAILAFDSELQATQQELARRKASQESLAEAHMEIEQLRNELAATQQQNSELKKQLSMADDIKQAEIRSYQEKVEWLKDELGRLHPDDGSVEGVGYLMDTCAKLLIDLEEESARQTTILREMGDYTFSIVKEVGESEGDVALHRPGRVIELPTGELVLRPYNVSEQSTQVIETDLLKVDVDAPIRFRTPMVRQLLAVFQGRDVRKMTVKELEAEIDRLYTAKTSADNEADAANLPRSEMAAFLVEFYLEQFGTVTGAQERVCSILSCIRGLERSAHLAPMPLKVSLFARFLQFCNVGEVLALPLLNVALQARRFANAGRHKVSADSKPMLSLQTRRPTLNQAKDEETQISIPQAWDAATKALPGGGSVISRRELFACLMRFATFPTDDPKNVGPDMNDFFVLLLIVHDRLRREAAPKMRFLISKVENRGTVTCDEFRDALRDAQMLGIEDSTWRSKLCPPAALGQQATLSDALMLEYLGGGSLNKIPRGHVTESQMLWATVEAVEAEVKDRIDGFRKIHRVNKESSDEKANKLNYYDFKAVLQSSDSTMSSSTIRSRFISSVEASRSCFQYDGDACPIAGSLEASPNQLYGGDVVTLQHMRVAMAKNLIREQVLDWSTAGKLQTGGVQQDPPNSPSNQSVTSSFQNQTKSTQGLPTSPSGMKSPRNR